MATRRELADRAAAAYAADSRVAAVVLGGSVSRGEHDRFSDIELGIFWDADPTDDDRREAIARAQGDVLRLYPYVEAETAWYDDWLLERVVVEAVHMTTAAMDRLLDAVVREHDPDPAKQVVIAAIVDGVSLHGDDVSSRWRDAAVYPDGLVRAVVDANAQISNFWHVEMASARDNPFLVYRKIVEVHERMLRVLLAVNRVYWYGFKSLDGIERRLTIAPNDIAARIRAHYRDDVRDVEADLTALVEETYDLVERHVPGVDVDWLRRVFHHRHEPRDDAA